MISLSRWQVKIGLVLFWCVTIFTPLIIMPNSISFDSGNGWFIEPMYVFLFGTYNPPGGAEPSGWLTGPVYVLSGFMFLFLFIVYALLVTNYCNKPNTQRGPIVVGLISLLIPAFLAVMIVPFDAWQSGLYVGPLPFQFIIGLILMQVVKRGIEKPKDELLDKKSSWWKESQDNPSTQ